MTNKERGAGRIASSLVLLIGLAGGAEHGAVQLSSAPWWVLALGLGCWGAARMEHGPSLPRLARWWAGTRLNPRALIASLNFPARRRHAHVYLRAARR